MGSLDSLVRQSNALRARSEQSQHQKLDLLQGLEINQETEKFDQDLDEAQTMYAECLKNTKNPEDQFVCSQKMQAMLKRL